MQQFISLNGTGAGAVVREFVSVPDGLTPGEDIFTPEFAATLLPLVEGVEVGWVQQKDGSYAAPSELEVAPVVPTSVSSAQAKIQLRRAGLRDKVDAAIKDADGEVQDWFSDARVWERDNQHVIDIGAGLGLKPADIDALFVAAAQIAV